MKIQALPCYENGSCNFISICGIKPEARRSQISYHNLRSKETSPRTWEQNREHDINTLEYLMRVRRGWMDFTSKIELNKEHVTVHRTCVSSYTSKTNISRIEKRRLSEDLESARKSKCLRSDDPTDKSGEAFDIKKHCLFSSDVHECKLYN